MPAPTVRIERVGSRLSGNYRITIVTHLYGAGPAVRHPVRLRRQGVRARLTDLIGRVGGRAAPVGGLPGLVVGSGDQQRRPGEAVPGQGQVPGADRGRREHLGAAGQPRCGGRPRGMQWVPEIDDEVLVGFELDDTNRPIVLGGLWNRSDTPPRVRRWSTAGR